MEDRERKLLRLQDRAGGVGSAIRTSLRKGRFEVATSGLDPNLQLTGGDPWGTQTYTGLIVPSAPTTSAQTRYLFMLARYSFNGPESAWIRGIRTYVSLFGTNANGQGPFELEVTSPMWRFSIAGGNVTFHVQAVPRRWVDKRNPANTDSVVFRDATAPALLYQSLAPYVPPNAGRPDGRPVSHDIGTLHDLRNQWRTDRAERSLRIPISSNNDIAIFASVWQHDPGDGGGNRPTFSATEAAAASPEDRFWAAFSNVQYGRIAASLIIGEKMGKEQEP